MFAVVVSVHTVQADFETKYYRIENSTLYEEQDLEITSIGLLGFNDNKEGHVDLTYIESDKKGNALAFDAGGGYVFNGDGYVSLYLGLGISLGYNDDDEDFITTLYPETGIVVNITQSFGLTISRKRYFDLYESTQDIIMLGLVFR